LDGDQRDSPKTEQADPDDKLERRRAPELAAVLDAPVTFVKRCTHDEMPNNVSKRKLTKQIILKQYGDV